MTKKYIRNILLTIVIALIAFYFWLPAINLRSPDLYMYIIFVLAVFAVISAFTAGKSWFDRGFSVREIISDEIGKAARVVLGLIALCVVVLLLGKLISAEIFHASAYQKLMPVENREFSEDISQISLKEVPVVDRDTAVRLGNRKLGELVDLVSQFEVSEDDYSYTQINYNSVPTRVAPLMYGDVIKWFNNQSDGIPGYISVDMTTQEVSLVRLQDGIKYSPGEYFFRNLDRHLRLSYPTLMFDSYSFEIDDEGRPYWICPTYTYTIGIFGGKDISGVVIMNAQDGSSQYYDIKDVPQWVDKAYSSDLVVNQIDYWGKYRKGFINTLIGQKEVCLTSGGYNYLALDDDVWLYTGLTSAGNDQSNIGFVLVNMRTKEAHYYISSGATEYSAMDSAEGQVQHLQYTATFPVLLNIANQPTYFLSLKDNAGLVKKFAYVNVEQYQLVGIGDNLNEAYTNYLKLTSSDGEVDMSALKTITKTVTSIDTAVKDGNTYYYIQVAGEDKVFIASIGLNDLLAVLKEGDRVTISYVDSDERFITINTIE